MSFLPDIVDGKVVDLPVEKKPYTPPRYTPREGALIEDERLTELNNFDRQTMSEDFSDSPALRGYGKGEASRVSHLTE